MRTRGVLSALAVFLFASVSASPRAQAPDVKSTAAKGVSAQHVMVMGGDIKWGPGPDALPAGVQVAVLQGDPSIAGAPFVLRAKMPDGFVVPPHWHPTDEGVTVLSGTMMAGMGEKLDEAAMKALGPGSYVLMPKKSAHYIKTRGETIIQVHAVGPFDVVYINPKDDPRKKTTTEQ